MGLLNFILPNKSKFDLATNVLMAEYNLSKVSGNTTKAAMYDIISNLIIGFRLDTQEKAYARFLSESRLVQLALLANGFSNTNVAPMLQGEFWTHIRNPFLPNIYDSNSIDAVRSRIFKTHGEDIEISDDPITSEELSLLFSR
jgi:hypothetical protein